MSTRPLVSVSQRAGRRLLPHSRTHGRHPRSGTGRRPVGPPPGARWIPTAAQVHREGHSKQGPQAARLSTLSQAHPAGSLGRTSTCHCWLWPQDPAWFTKTRGQRTEGRDASQVPETGRYADPGTPLSAGGAQGSQQALGPDHPQASAPAPGLALHQNSWGHCPRGLKGT